MEPQVAFVGLVTLDVQQVVRRLPGPDEKTVAESALLTFGGPAANAAATAALLGARSTLVTGCGDGPVGRLVRQEVAERGVDLVDLAADDRPGPAVSSVLVDAATGDRAVVSTNAAGIVLDTARLELPPPTRCLLVDGHHMAAALAAVERARDLGVPVLLDGGSWKDGTDRLLAHVDVAVLSADFRPPGGGDPAERALAAGCRVVAVSHGREPLLLHVAGRRPVAIPVARTAVVDTVGAGDVLHGAVAYALACGADPVADALAVMTFGTGLASLSCGYRGARGWSDEPGARAAAATLTGELVTALRAT